MHVIYNKKYIYSWNWKQYDSKTGKKWNDLTSYYKKEQQN